MKYIIICLFLLFVGCTDNLNRPYVEPEYKTAPENYMCTTEQFQRVMIESEWCNKHTSYMSSYCWGTAMIRNCTKVEKEIQNNGR
jgi:hypothetical protein